MVELRRILFALSEKTVPTFYSQVKSERMRICRRICETYRESADNGCLFEELRGIGK